jgi:hypothetical protein
LKSIYQIEFHQSSPDGLVVENHFRKMHLSYPQADSHSIFATGPATVEM